jgi:hypothetical protein
MNNACLIIQKIEILENKFKRLAESEFKELNFGVLEKI